ncbi:MAG TPA: TVP38/TMEM64 family protein, partial [Sneathiellales bacterium]|nr:TVP38/TMEM64 family protein [Sneathiellales bacterium]
MAAVAFIAVYAAAIAVSVPGAAILTMTSGFLFGAVVGTLCAVTGATIGAVIVFAAARTAVGDLLKAKAGPRLKKMEAGFRENAFSYLLTLRLIPIFPFWLINLAPAFLGVPILIFFAATFIGIIPGGF